jgi:hypothetical protein
MQMGKGAVVAWAQTGEKDKKQSKGTLGYCNYS